jgi:PrtD family type I secretion system ABC transporter
VIFPRAAGWVLGIMDSKSAKAELTAPIWRMSHLFLGVAAFSFVVNLLMLTGSLYMLQVYDRVLASHSLPTLVVISMLAGAMFVAMGFFEHLRARVLARVGARYQDVLDARAFDAGLSRAMVPTERARPMTALRDLDAIQKMLAGPAPLALFDAPWTPMFILFLYYLHPWMGWMGVASVLVLAVLALANELASRGLHEKATAEQGAADAAAQSIRRDAETVGALGMRGSMVARWRARRQTATDARMRSADLSGGFSSTSKTLRFFLQSAMLGLGAYLVVKGEVTGGVMIASSILMGRALAPVEQAIAQWSVFQRAREAWSSLNELFASSPPRPERVPLPPLGGGVSARELVVGAPGARAPTVTGITFDVAPGQAMGVIGPSGAGKSTLARVLVGIWPEVSGTLRFGGATLNQWDPDDLGRQVGYMSQEAALFDGTVFENVTRFAPAPDHDAAIDAIGRAGALELILGLPDGLNTPVGVGGAQLSGGQRQRIALARAFYGDPHVYVFDEPNANLDSHGEQALLGAIDDLKKRGKVVVVIAHRPSAIMLCDTLLMIQGGRQVDFGTRDEVLRRTVQTFPRAVPQPAPQAAPEPAVAIGGSK